MKLSHFQAILYFAIVMVLVEITFLVWFSTYLTVNIYTKILYWYTWISVVINVLTLPTRVFEELDKRIW